MSSWMRVGRSLQALAAHNLLFSFTVLLILKLNSPFHFHTWWVLFSPLWLFHAVLARGRFSLPAPVLPHGRHWAPCHAVMATPLLVSFELLLCIYLSKSFVLNLKIVFLPLLAFELAVLIDNVRMCRALMPGDDESTSDEAIWATLPYFWVAISMVFFIAATTFTLLKLCGDVAAPGWWDLFINFGIAECFSFLVCTKWYNPATHGGSHTKETGSSLMRRRHLDSNRGLVISSDEDEGHSRLCSLQDIGGHITKIPLICFQILLFMRLEVSWAGGQLMKEAKKSEHGYFVPALSQFFFQIYRYNTFSPDVVKKMPKTDLVEEGQFCFKLDPHSQMGKYGGYKLHFVSRQTEITRYSKQEYERLQNEKILCRVCFEDQINMVLLPCRHHVLCSSCCEKCKKCPICRVPIEGRLPVYDAQL